MYIVYDNRYRNTLRRADKRIMLHKNIHTSKRQGVYPLLTQAILTKNIIMNAVTLRKKQVG